MPPGHAREKGEAAMLGHSVVPVEKIESSADSCIETAWESYQQTKQDLKEGRLVSWQDAFKSQKVDNAFTIDLYRANC